MQKKIFAPYKLGDIDSNGKITSVDAVILKRWLAKWNISINESAADIDGNGKVTSADAVLLSRYLAKWNIPFFN